MPSITYGGVTLAAYSLTLAERIESEINPADVYESQAPDWPGLGRQTWPFPWRRNLRPIRIGRLFWPCAEASRWAIGHFLATDRQLQRLHPLVYGLTNTAWNALPLVLSDGRRGYSIATNLYMLPPRPLAQKSGTNGLHLLTLVDDRFRWWERAAAIPVAPGTTTWANLFAAVATGLGITLTADTIAAAYLKPPAELTAHYEFLPLLLDAVCRCTGQRFVRQLDGTCTTQTPATAKTAHDGQLASWKRLKGGLFALLSPQPNDLNALVPSEVLVRFPATTGGMLQATPHAETITLASLSLTAYQGAVGHSGTRVFHDTAVYDTAGGNAAEIAALAQQIATNFYGFALGRQDQAYLGAVPYQPEGLSDSIEWSLCEEAASTRVQRGPWDDRVEDLLHYGTYAAAGPTFPSPVAFTGPVALSSGLSLAPTTEKTISADQDNYPLDDNVVQLWKPTGADRTITGIVPNATYRYQIVYNTSATYRLLLAPENSSSSATNRFQTPDGGRYVLPPGGFTVLWHDDAVANRWRFTLCCDDQTKWPDASSSLSLTSDQTITPGAGGTTQRFTTDASRTLQGIAAPNPATARVLTLLNTGSNPAVIGHQNGTATATNRIVTPTGADFLLEADQAATFLYVPSEARWYMIGVPSAGTSGGDITVSRVKVTVLFSDLFAASPQNNIEIYSGPAGSVYPTVKVKPDDEFNDGLNSTYTVSLGITDLPNQLTGNINVGHTAPPSDTNLTVASPGYGAPHGGTISIRLFATGGANLDSYVQGSLDIWLWILDGS